MNKKGLIIIGIIIATLAYFVFPIDIIPDIIAGFGQLDDLLVALAGTAGVIATLLSNNSEDPVAKQYSNTNNYNGSFTEL